MKKIILCLTFLPAVMLGSQVEQKRRLCIDLTNRALVHSLIYELHQAIRNNNIQRATEILDQGVYSDLDTAGIAASAHQDTFNAVIRYIDFVSSHILIESNVDTIEKMQKLIARGAEPIISQHALSDPALVEFLIMQGASVNRYQVKEGLFHLTVLMNAIKQGYVESVRLLLQHGADPLQLSGYVPSCRGPNPKPINAYVVAGKSNNIEMIKLLHEHAVKNNHKAAADYLAQFLK